MKEVKMPVKSGKISLNTQGNNDICNITKELSHLITNSELISGVLTVFAPSSTSGLTTIEFEPGAVADLKRVFEELVPSNKP
jgi:thiamine phosphate synthase YjbQ (UPF0047 family)